MPTSKKPRKKYRPKPAVIPLNIRNRWMTEGDAHALLMAIEGGTFCEQHMADLVAHADIVGKIAKQHGDEVVSRHSQALMRIAIQIQERYLSTGKFTVTSLEETAIRASMTITIPVMEAASNLDILRAAESSLKRLKHD